MEDVGIKAKKLEQDAIFARNNMQTTVDRIGKILENRIEEFFLR